MTPLLLVCFAVVLVIAVWVFTRVAAERAHKQNVRLARARPAPPVAPTGPTFAELVERIHRELVERRLAGRRPALGPEAEKRDIRRVIEHLVDSACPLLNRIERALLIEEVLGRIPRFAPPAAEKPAELPPNVIVLKVPQRRQE